MSTLVAGLFLSGAASNSITSNSAPPPTMADERLPPRVRIGAAKRELLTLQQEQRPDAERMADIAETLGDLLGDLVDANGTEHHKEAIYYYKRALIYHTRTSSPRKWASLQNNLASEFNSDESGNARANIQKALSAQRAALTVFTRERDPERWAMGQRNLCIMLRRRVAGSRSANIEAAIAACRLALTVQTREAAPERFAAASESLARTYGDRVVGSARANLDAQISAYEDALAALDGKGGTPALEGRLGALYAERGERPDGAGADLDRAITLLTAGLSHEPPETEDADRAQLEQQLGNAYLARKTGDRSANIDQAIAAYRRALALVSRSEADDWSTLQVNLGDALRDRTAGDRGENIAGAIAAYRSAISVSSEADDPANWALMHNRLGAALDDRIQGSRTENLSQAVAAYQVAVRIARRLANKQALGDYLNNLGVAYGHQAENEPGAAERAIRCLRQALAIRKVHSPAWGETQNNLGTVLLRRQRGGAAANIEAAIAAFEQAVLSRPRSLDPAGWAQSTDNLGNAYVLRVRGDTVDNLERAIHAFDDALAVRTLKAAPRDWAATMSNLGEALVDRQKGSRNDNVERAVEAYLAALTVYKRTSDPAQWAAVEDNLGAAYLALDRGSRAANLKLAVAAHKAALTVRDQQTRPMEWAGTQNNLALALAALPSDRRANVDAAVKAHEETLKVWTREAAPFSWAMALNNLAVLLTDRDYRDRSAGVERAIGLHAEALGVRTRDAFPEQWADTQNNLALAYMARQAGDPAINVGEAIRHFQAALEVRTRRGDPLKFMATQKALARAYAKRGSVSSDDQRLADEAYRAAMGAVDELIGDGVDPRQIATTMSAAGELFRSAALHAGRQGHLADALAIAERGRARILQLALQLDDQRGLLAPAEQNRVDTLRAALRAAEAQAERAPRPDELDADRAALAEGKQSMRQKAEALRSAIAALLPSRPPISLDAAPPDGGAIIVPIVAQEGAMILLLTGRGLSALDLPRLDDARMRSLFYGSSAEFGAGGWSRGYQAVAASPEDGGLPTDWVNALAAFQDDALALFWEPLSIELQRQGIMPGARLTLVTQDYLARMPLWLAKYPATGKIVADVFRITSAPNLASLKTKPRALKQDLAAWFNGRALPALQLTELARQLFASRAGPATFIDNKDATSADAILLRMNGHGEWFFWTHGSFDTDDANASYLQLAVEGGSSLPAQLTVGKLLDLHLGALGPNLVVLSACETGLADVSRNDELIGLSTALLQAGAKGVISAMWPVREDATALMMAKFGELSAGTNLSPSEALRRAALWLRSATADDLIRYVNQSHVPVASDPVTAQAYDKMLAVLEDNPSRRPFADPYFWAAFHFFGSE